MRSPRKISVAHVITDLDVGGAEMMLYKVLSKTDCSKFNSHVISLSDQGPIGERLGSLGIAVKALGMRSKVNNPLRFPALISWLRRDSPDIVQTWMYHGDLFGGLAAKFAGDIPVVWNIRHSTFGQKSKRSTLWIRKISAWLSRSIPDLIVTNSEVAKELHIGLGYDREKMVVIPNGFDLDAFRPDPVARVTVRRELGLADDTPLIGYIARFHLQKDHQTFVKAAGLLKARFPEVQFVLCGHQIDFSNQQLAEWIASSDAQGHFHLLGQREDIPRITAALDIATSSASHGEAFPNVIGEAMACGVPCVVTDVGDSAFIVGDTNLVVTPRDSIALSETWSRLLSCSLAERQSFGEVARRRVEKHFSLEMVTRKYEQLYTESVKETIDANK